jgi:hypothetical protein
MATRAAEIVGRLLADSPGEALCDSCLAFACDMSLPEMREITRALVAEYPVHPARSDLCQLSSQGRHHPVSGGEHCSLTAASRTLASPHR